MSIFDKKYKNDDTGAPVYDPAILLKIVLYGYSKGIVSSRKIARCCRENIIFMALSADTRPHFTTVAEFISSMDKEIIHLFRDILLICDDQGLIGKERRFTPYVLRLVSRHLPTSGSLFAWIDLLYAANKSECPVEPVLHCTQHEKDSTLWAWICIITRENGRMPLK